MTILAFSFLTFGSIFILLAGIGLLRMPTFFMRMQATSKAATLGIIFMTIGLNLHLRSWEVLIKSSLICLFLLLTTPVATHALAIAAKKSRYDL